MTVPPDQGWQEMRRPGFPPGLGALWARQGAAGWEYGLPLTPEHANPTGVVHGGVLMLLADHALSLLAWEAAGRVTCVTVQLCAYFLRPVQPSGLLCVSGAPSRLTGSLAFMAGEVRDAAGEVVARADGVWRIMRPRPG